MFFKKSRFGLGLDQEFYSSISLQKVELHCHTRTAAEIELARKLYKMTRLIEAAKVGDLGSVLRTNPRAINERDEVVMNVAAHYISVSHKLMT